MHIQIITPEKTIFDGEAYGVQLPGLHGSFEMLDNHAPMVAALGEGTLKILMDNHGKDAKIYQLSGGVAEMNIGNKAVIMAESITE